MAEPFKNLINLSLVLATAARLRQVWPAFDAPRFITLASDGLNDRELKARAMLVCDALEATLPEDFTRAADILEAALAQPHDGERMADLTITDEGLKGWILWSVGEFVARRGLATPERALRTLHAITQRFTAEFAIRPFIVAHPDLVYATLLRWATDPSAHVRRLVSEGSRPRLPWGLQLKRLIDDPSPSLPLLRALQDDPSAYVRKSVANHLNDIAKDHPTLVAEWVEMYLPGASTERRGLLKHACRTLIKQGNARILKAWGLGTAFAGTCSLKVTPRRLALGEHLTLTVSLQSTSTRSQSLSIDYVVHHVKANGRTSPKVFKGWVTALAPKAALVLVKRHSMRLVTTRRYHAGLHVIELQVNGRSVGQVEFRLTL